VAERTIEDQLREQYVTLLPELTRVAEHLKTQIEYFLLPIARHLKPHESLLVKARVKDCNSAIDKLRRGNPGGVFDRNHPEIYNLLSLRDLVGVRVMAFPSGRAMEVDRLLRLEFGDWIADPIRDGTGKQLAFKYNGQYTQSPMHWIRSLAADLAFKYRRYTESVEDIPCEYQIVSTLIGLFWDIEHAAIYKQAPNLKGLEPVMREQTYAVYLALKAFEDEFERQIQISESSTHD